MSSAASVAGPLSSAAFRCSSNVPWSSRMTSPNRSALSAKLRDGELKVVQGFSLADHKSKGMRAVLTQLEVANKVLVVENGENRNLTLGTRNLEGVTLVESKDVSVYLLLGHKQVLLSETAAKKLSEALAK